jgi:hypothetical protein
MALNLQGFAVIGRKITEGASCALLDGISLTGQTTTANVNEQVVLGLKPKGLEGGLDRRQVDRVVIEIIVTRAAIDGDATGSRYDADPSNGGFTAAGSPIHNSIR